MSRRASCGKLKALDPRPGGLPEPWPRPAALPRSTAGINRTHLSELEKGTSDPGLEIIANVLTVPEVALAGRFAADQLRWFRGTRDTGVGYSANAALLLTRFGPEMKTKPHLP